MIHKLHVGWTYIERKEKRKSGRKLTGKTIDEAQINDACCHCMLTLVFNTVVVRTDPFLTLKFFHVKIRWYIIIFLGKTLIIISNITISNGEFCSNGIMYGITCSIFHFFQCLNQDYFQYIHTIFLMLHIKINA